MIWHNLHFFWYVLYGMYGYWGIEGKCLFFIKGRRERGCASPGGVRSRMVRIPKYSAVTLWLRTVAAPSSLPAGS